MFGLPDPETPTTVATEYARPMRSLAALAALVIVAGCKFPELTRRSDGGDVDGPPEDGTQMDAMVDAVPDMMTMCTAPMVAIASNHGHVLSISTADLAAGVDKTYDIQAAATHAHDVTIVSAQFAQINLGQMVMVTSTLTASHTHAITVTCME